MFPDFRTRDFSESSARRLVICVIEEGHNTFIKTFFPGDVDGILEGTYYTVRVERYNVDPILVTLDDAHVIGVTV